MCPQQPEQFNVVIILVFITANFRHSFAVISQCELPSGSRTQRFNIANIEAYELIQSRDKSNRTPSLQLVTKTTFSPRPAKSRLRDETHNSGPS